MAQLSKKDHIAKTAFNLFLEHGIKGTSIDMVVKASKVSKPTVYNHFSDKAMLLAHVVHCWADEQPTPAIRARSIAGLFRELPQTWLKADTLRLYGLFLGEGFRAPQARTIFKNQVDMPWRETLALWAQKHKDNPEKLNTLVDGWIFRSLF